MRWLGPEWPAECAAEAIVLDMRGLDCPGACLEDARLRTWAIERAVVLVAPELNESDRQSAFLAGVQDVVDGVAVEDMERALAHAIYRKRAERARTLRYATDVATGLPHEAQLLEHVTQLLALREREPAPMVLIMLRVVGLEAVAQRHGGEAADVLRRKLAVRLRSGLRASDVVASIASEAFAVLLPQMEAIVDGDAVMAKLVRILQQPFQVSGRAAEVAVSAGLARFPDHGRTAADLMRHASAQAFSVVAMGGEGLGMAAGRKGDDRAANDGP
jgi:diguanylate cyclase (GGDEF)-like protein